jgi:alkylation response protein AidB-like acyl-CoA dehydrogenase
VESRAKGLSLLIVDLRAKGVTVRPLPTIDGEQLNEITLDEVEVPLEDRVGPENGAWALVNEALAVERHVQFPPKRLRRDLEELVSCLAKSHLLSNAGARERLAELAVDVLEAEALAHDVVIAMSRGDDATVEAAANKLAHTEVAQKIASAALDLAPDALTLSAPFAHLWQQSTWETIGGGTSEIMRSVIARRLLELPAAR